MHYDWGRATAKKETCVLWAAHIKLKRQYSATLIVVGWNSNMAVCIESSESLNLRDLEKSFDIGKKLKTNIFKKNGQISSTVTTRERS